MTATRESESPPPTGERHHRWWLRPLVQTTGAIYTGQLVPFVAGPLTECGHCVGNYLRYFLIVPGTILGQWLMHFLDKIVPGNQRLMMGPDWIRISSGILVLGTLIFCLTMLTAKVQGKWRWVWLGLLAILSAANALIFSALLRA